MSEESDIKAFTPVVCPKCNETMVVEFSIGASLLAGEEAEKILGGVEQPQIHESEEEA